MLRDGYGYQSLFLQAKKLLKLEIQRQLVADYESDVSYRNQEKKSLVIETSLLPTKQQPTQTIIRVYPNMPVVRSGRICSILTAMVGTILAFTVLSGLAIAGVTKGQAETENFRQNSDLSDELLAELNSSPEGVSLVKRTAVTEPQRFRQRQRQLSSFGIGRKSSFSLPDIVNNEYTAERWNGTWVSDIEFAYRNRQGDLALLR